MCKVEECNLPQYHYNPMVFPLLSFHGRVMQTLDALPEKGKVFEIAKRVATVIVAPMAYFVLGLTALAGIVLDKLFIKYHSQGTKEQGEVDIRVPDRNRQPVPLQGFDKFLKTFGGRERFEEIPELAEWDGRLNVQIMTSSVMRTETDDKLYVLFLVNEPEIDRETGQPNGLFGTVVNYLCWNKEDSQIISEYEAVSQIMLNPTGKVLAGSMLENVIYDRVSRMLSGRYVGYAKRYNGLFLAKPENHDEFRPADAHLEGEELERFMDEKTFFYEVAQGDGEFPYSLSLATIEAD